MGFIDIDACAGIVTRMRDIATDVDAARLRLRSTAQHVDVDVSALFRIPTDTAAIRRLASELRTRVDLAIAIETARRGGFPGQVTGVVETSNASGDNLDAVLGRALADAALAVDPGDAASRAWLADLLREHDDKEDFATAFLSRLGGAETLSLLTNVAYADDGRPGDDQHTILTSLRRMLPLADRAWDAAEREAFGVQLGRAATWQDADVANRGRAFAYGAALSFLLTDQPFSPELSVGLARTLEEYERSLLASAGPYSPEQVWLQRMPGGNPFLAHGPGGADGVPPTATLDASAALMSSLARSPQAALAVFSRGADGTTTTPTLRHWLTDRTWTEDRFSLLSAALAAATTDSSILDDAANDWNRAIVTAAAVNLIGGRTDIDRDLLSEDSNAAMNFARILGANVLAMDYAVMWDADPGSAALVDANGSVWFGRGDLGPVPVFAAKTPSGDATTLSPLARFAVLASTTEESSALLRTAVDRWAKFKYAVSLGEVAASLEAAGVVVTADNGESQLRDHDKSGFQAAITSQGKLEGMLAHAVGRTDIDDAKMDDARRAMWAGLVQDTVGLVPYAKTVLGDFPQGIARRVIELGISKTEAAAIDSITTSDAGATRVAATKDAALALDRAEYQVVMTLATSDVVSPELAQGLLEPDGTPVSFETFSSLPSYKGRLLDDGAFGTLFGDSDLDGTFKSQWHIYYPES